MTRDLTPTCADLWRLVERYGSMAHSATAIGVEQEELQAWLSGTREIPLEHYDRLLALIEQPK